MTKTFNISFPQELLEKVDRSAKREYRSRSELLKEAAVFYLQSKDNWQILQADLAKKAKIMGLKNEGDIEELIDEGRS